MAQAPSRTRRSVAMLPFILVPVILVIVVLGFRGDVIAHRDGPAKKAAIDSLWTKVPDVIVHVNSDEDVAHGITTRGVVIDGSPRQVFEDSPVNVFCNPQGACRQDKPSVFIPSTSELVFEVVVSIIVLAVIFLLTAFGRFLILGGDLSDSNPAKAKPRKPKLDLV